MVDQVNGAIKHPELTNFVSARLQTQKEELYIKLNCVFGGKNGCDEGDKSCSDKAEQIKAQIQDVNKQIDSIKSQKDEALKDAKQAAPKFEAGG